MPSSPAYQSAPTAAAATKSIDRKCRRPPTHGSRPTTKRGASDRAPRHGEIIVIRGNWFQRVRLGIPDVGLSDAAAVSDKNGQGQLVRFTNDEGFINTVNRQRGRHRERGVTDIFLFRPYGFFEYI